MKTKFPGYYKLTDEELGPIWDAGFVVLDANVLLNLYRYSPETRDNMLDVLEKVKERLWLPYQVAEEYHINRVSVIEKQIAKCDEASKTIQSLFDQLDKPREQPFVDKDVYKKSQLALKDLANQINLRREECEKLFTVDPYRDRLLSLVGDRIGEEPTVEEREAVGKEATRRIECGIPPGQRDAKKSDGRVVGDAILWMETITFAKENNTSVILVTDDVKDDWWFEVRGKRISPRPELVKEFVVATGRKFVMYEPRLFLEEARKRLRVKMPQSSIEEVEEVTNRRLLSSRERSKQFDIANYVSELSSHAERHEDDIRVFVSAVEAMDRDLLLRAESSIQLPVELSNAMGMALVRCPCIDMIWNELRSIDQVDWMRVRKKPAKMTPTGYELISRLRRCPSRALQFAHEIAETCENMDDERRAKRSDEYPLY